MAKKKEVVIAYALRHRDIADVENNWSTIEKETYAIVHAVKQFYPYLYGRKFQVLSDHKPLREPVINALTTINLAEELGK